MPLITPSSGKDRVILGLMTFGPPGTEDKGSRITSLDEYNKCLDYFQSQSYSEIDTARVYIAGQQEAFTKEAKWQERGLTLATKVSSIRGLMRDLLLSRDSAIPLSLVCMAQTD